MAVQTISVRVKADLRREINEVAKAKGLTFTKILHEALEMWLNNLK